MIIGRILRDLGTSLNSFVSAYFVKLSPGVIGETESIRYFIERAGHCRVYSWLLAEQFETIRRESKFEVTTEEN